jgi:Asp/Glu/hydantoin racemase
MLMSKDTPKILDIWKDEEGRKFTIIETTHKYIYVASRKLRGRGITIKTFTHAKIRCDWLYLGKSKASIEQLFEVENEE